MGSNDDVTVKIWLHPSIELPFDVGKNLQVTVPASFMISDLMARTEALIENLGRAKEASIEMQIDVVWNSKNSKKTLDPRKPMTKFFKTGDTVCISGDVVEGEPEEPTVPETDKLPVTILTGFLGSGKTTLLNYILQEQKEKKVAVIENEFGAVSIDDELLKQDKLALAEKIVVMDNGCMCCTVRGDLLDGLKEILAEIKKGAKIDQIIIETTGMADPVPIVRTFMTSPEITDELRLDGVVTLADAKHIIARLDDKVEEGKVNEAYQQIAFCDKLILNKLDLVTSEEAIAVKQRLRSVNQFARILPAINSRVKITDITDMRAHDMAHFADVEIEKAAGEAPVLGHNGGHGHGHGHGSAHGGHGDDCGDENCTEDHGAGGGHGHIQGHGQDEPPSKKSRKSRHDSRVNSFAIVKEGEILAKNLGEWMEMMKELDEDRGIIFRVKAILALRDHPFKHVYHAVMDVANEDDVAPWADNEKRVCKIVFIGKGMDQKFLKDAFERIVVKPKKLK